MSLWIPHRSAAGHHHWYLVEVPLFAVIPILGIGFAVMINMAVNAPLESLIAFSSFTFLGFILFLTAKISVYRTGFWFSFGPSQMSPGMKRLYRLGYLLMIPGTVMCVLLSMLVMRFHG